uniref:CSON014876 protein n=1 Tax=Culicoides sonorensis TaxID=179676 RepID=A0A336MD42_CULSO
MKIILVTLILVIGSQIEARPQSVKDGAYDPDFYKQYLGYWKPDGRGQYKATGSSSGPSGSGASKFGSSKFGSSSNNRGAFGNSVSSSSNVVRGSGPSSTFTSTSNTIQNTGIQAIGISSSVLPPLTEDSDEFAGFSPNSVSTFTSNGNSGSTNRVNNNNAGQSSSGFGASSSANRFSASTSGGSSSKGGSQSSKSGNGSTKSGFNGNSAFASNLNNGFTSANGASSSSSSSFSSNSNGFGKSSGSTAPPSDGDAKVLRLENDADENGYHYLYETDNKIQAEETGRFVNKGAEDEHLAATGFFEYVGPDGVKYRVDYTADENGFQAKGDHLPTPPPVPEAIQRALDAQGLKFP